MGLFSRFERTIESTVEGVADRFSSAPVSPAAIAKRLEKKMHSERMVGSGKQYAPTLYTVLVNPQDDRAMMGYYPTLSGELETMLVGRANESGLTMDGQPLVRFIADNSLRSGKFDVIAETVAAPIVEQLRDDELQRYGITRGRYEAELAQKKARARAEAQEARREELRARSAGRAQQQERRGVRDRLNAIGRGAGRQDADPYAPQYAQDAYMGNDAFDEEYDDSPYYGSEPGPDGKRRLPYVPEEEIDRSIDYGEYTFNSLNFDELENQVAEEPYETAAQQSAPAAAPVAAPAAQAPAAQAPQAWPAQAAPAAQPVYSQAAAPVVQPTYEQPAAPAVEAPVYRPAYRPAPEQTYEPAYAAPAAAPAAAQSAAGTYGAASAPTPEASAYRTPVNFTPAARIAPEAQAMPARIVPGVMDREQPTGTATTAFTGTPAAPATLPYSDLAKPAPRYRVRNLQNGRSYTLTGTRVYIGRESTCNIAVEDPNASRRHAELRSTSNGVWTITDLNSTNGTFLNGSQIATETLADGDRITIGTTDLIFVVC